MSAIVDNIRKFMNTTLGIDSDDIALDAPLFSSGIVDSFSLVSLLSFIEGEYNIRIGPTEVTIDNFDSFDRILSYLDSKSVS
ncbi:MAG: acyl carrier protein [Halioglobus sp.]